MILEHQSHFKSYLFITPLVIPYNNMRIINLEPLTKKAGLEPALLLLVVERDFQRFLN